MIAGPPGGGPPPSRSTMPLVVVPISAIEHHAYCPRQCALIHVDGVWVDNRFTVAGTRAHRRVDSGEQRRERGRVVLRSIPLWSEGHGLSGRADAVEIADDGTVQPVEYKSGSRHGMSADLQVCAQAICLEEMLGLPVTTGAIWYGGTRRRRTVLMDVDLRRETLEVVDEIRRTIETGILPDAPNDERCSTCQLASHCLPEIVSDVDLVTTFVNKVVLECGT